MLTQNMTARYSIQALEDDAIRNLAPSIFATHPWAGMSPRYTFIPTASVLHRMRTEGFYPVKAQQSRCRTPGKGEYTKHLIRFRQTISELMLNEVFPEVVLVNSHDGASSFQCYAGLFRLICLNGMITGAGNFAEYKTRHSGHLDNVIDAVYHVVEDFPQLTAQIANWRDIQLSAPQQLAYADAARKLRWDETDTVAVEPAKLLTVRRQEDTGNSLWLTYQRTQENLLKGGLSYLSTTPNSAHRLQHRHTRAVSGVSEDVRLNRALWTLTEKMAELVGQTQN